MDSAKKYEDLIRRNLGKDNVRYGDPAGMADTDKFNDGHINELKVTLGYAMLTFENKKLQGMSAGGSNSVEKVHKYLERTIQASSIKEITSVMNDFISLEKCYQD